MIDPTPYRVPGGANVDLDDYDPGTKEGFDGKKPEGKRALKELNVRLSDLQARLWGEGRQRLLVVLQAMDTGGKDGTIRHVFTGVNPQGVHVRGFNKPTEDELARDYLWRVHHVVPESGAITIFNRSHYEDVLVVRVRSLVPEARWQKRFDHINDFERMLTDEGTTIVKLYLNISKDEQRDRLQARLDEPNKNWKFNKGDLEDRKLWGVFRGAYQDMLSRTSTEHAPWYIVPANRKWYRNLVVSSILIDTLETMDPRYPPPEEGLDEIVVD